MSIYHSHFPDATGSEGLNSSPVDQTEEMDEEVVTISSTGHGIGREGEKSLLEKMLYEHTSFYIVGASLNFVRDTIFNRKLFVGDAQE